MKVEDPEYHGGPGTWVLCTSCPWADETGWVVDRIKAPCGKGCPTDAETYAEACRLAEEAAHV
jgi:ferredoxin